MSWERKPLGEILEQSGVQRAGDWKLPVLSITMKHGLIDQADKFKKRVASQDTSNYRVVHEKELVVGFPIDEGVLGFQTRYPAAIVSPAYDVWRLKDEAACHIPYLERYLRSSQARHLYAARMQGAVARRRSLTKADFLKLEIPFPPLDDQIRIAHLLEKSEGLMAKRKQHLEQLERLQESVFLEVFGDPVSNQRKWESAILDSFIDQERGISYGIVQRGDHFPNGVPVLRIRDVISEEYTASELVRTDPSTSAKYSRTILQGGELLLSIRGTVGTVSVAPPHSRGWNVSRELAVIPVHGEINKCFLVHLLKSPPMQRQFESMIKGVAQSGLNLSDIRLIRIITPSLDTQRSFESVAMRIEGLVDLYRKSFADLESFHGALSQQAFMGGLDVSRVPLPHTPPQRPLLATQTLTASPKSASTAIELPGTELPPEALQSSEHRRALLNHWLVAFRAGMGGAPFSAQAFMAAAQRRLAELHPDSDVELGADDYEHIKDWVFASLAGGQLAQGYEDEHNRVQVRSVASEA